MQEFHVSLSFYITFLLFRQLRLLAILYIELPYKQESSNLNCRNDIIMNVNCLLLMNQLGNLSIETNNLTLYGLSESNIIWVIFRNKQSTLFYKGAFMPP